MGDIFITNQIPNDFKLGAIQVDKVIYGSEQVWPPAAPPFPPTGAVARYQLDVEGVDYEQVGGKISLAYDQISGRDFEQATDANRPTLLPAELDGHGAAQFSGDQWLAASFAISQTIPHTLWAVYQGPNSNEVVFRNSSAALWRGIGSQDITDGSNFVQSTPPGSTSDWVQAQGVNNAGSSKMFSRGTNQGGTGTLTGGTGNNFEVGRSIDAYPSYTFNGKLVEWGWYDNDISLTSTLADLQAYLATKYPSIPT